MHRNERRPLALLDSARTLEYFGQFWPMTWIPYLKVKYCSSYDPSHWLRMNNTHPLETRHQDQNLETDYHIQLDFANGKI